jgi:hypothetical protein
MAVVSRPRRARQPEQGLAQLNEIWRWVEGLPASTTDAVPLAEMRRRAARLERIDALRDPGQYASPSLSGTATFRHGDHREYTIGYGEYEFKTQFSSRGPDSVYVYSEGRLNGLGLITSATYDPASVESFLGPAETVQSLVGQTVVLLNAIGALCVLTIDEAQDEVNDEAYTPAHVTFSWNVLVP